MSNLDPLYHAEIPCIAAPESLAMKGMNVEAYRKLANIKDIVELFGPRTLIREIGTEEMIRTL